MNCEYCQSNKDIINRVDLEYPNRITQVYVFMDELCVESQAKNGESIVANDEINFCPMCGRKL